MTKAVFLDRDGVINRELGHYCTNISEFEILEDVADSIKMLKDAGFLVIMISNQGGIAKGLYSVDDLAEMHLKLQKNLREHDTCIDDMFICMHHDSVSRCLCRKPNSLLLEKAIAIYGIDKSQSYMIGDSERDIIAAQNAGVKGILIESNTGILGVCKEIVGK
ncbi:MAG: HAD family hydrolase [Bacteroidales bacterium]|nr:HAD family hydrolase [Bacteroidales bacterium]